MPKFTLHRNFVLRTTKGHIISFIKGKPTNVPPVCVEAAVAIGAQPVEGDVNVLGDEKVAQPPMSPKDRKAKVFEAFETMKGRNERSDFTASGVPNAKRIPALTGFEITSNERDAYWTEFRALEQEIKDQVEVDVRAGRVEEAG